jgi:hypothetical protein
MPFFTLTIFGFSASGSCWDLLAGSGDLDSTPLVLVLLLIPIALLVMIFTTQKHTLVCATSITGFVGVIVLMLYLRNSAEELGRLVRLEFAFAAWFMVVVYV